MNNTDKEYRLYREKMSIFENLTHIVHDAECIIEAAHRARESIWKYFKDSEHEDA